MSLAPEPAPSGRRARILRMLAARLGGIVLVLWGSATLAFLVLKLVPGDPVDVILGPLSQVGPEGRAAVRARLGLDLPVHEQYLNYLGGLLRGDFGESYQQGKPVLQVISEQAAPTLALAAAALLLAVAVSLLAAVLVRRGVLRSALELLELLAVSAPVFWIALVLAAVFGYQLRWFPVLGGSELARLVLPAVALAVPLTGILAQVLRRGVDAVEREPFAETVLTRGASRRRFVWRHALRHALAGSLTLSGYLFGSVLGGAVLIETVFARPGLGRVTLDAILGRDIPVVMGIVVFCGIVFVIINQLVDALAALTDPRLRRTQLGRSSTISSSTVIEPTLVAPSASAPMSTSTTASTSPESTGPVRG